MLVCVSGLLAFLMAEGVTARWRARQVHQYPQLPAWRPRTDQGQNKDVNIVVIGGSSAYGLPFQNWLSTGDIVAWKLGEAIPGRRVHLDVLAEPGVHLEHMHTKLAAYRSRPDLLIIYSGHNEFTYRYRWSRSVEHYADEAPFRPVQLVQRWAGAIRRFAR